MRYWRICDNTLGKSAFILHIISVINHIGEQIARTRHQAHLTQAALAKRIDTTKSAISRYESADYAGYSLPLLKRIAKACRVNLRIIFVAKRTENGSRAVRL